MRTSIDLPDDLFRQLKILAAKRCMTIRALVQQALEREVAHARAQATGKRLRFPLLDSKEPKTLTLTNAAIEDLLT